ncbi:signal peptide-containing protein [Purpureocillium lavendulum]|uniref:Signal peptide-containing protein n=1 Tax=Purpureocillium lavendulum TaxID=1247861 RepID=A0AB34G7B0_9HYPO|nr:signal peptide-containing protein [Purpureocillium lavendulum]
MGTVSSGKSHYSEYESYSCDLRRRCLTSVQSRAASYAPAIGALMDNNDYQSGDESPSSTVDERTRRGREEPSRQAPVEKEGPACQACRKKKAKCSRNTPCSQCVKHKVDCVYDDKKSKPGMRPGAIESLSQRLASTQAVLEQMFMGQGVLWQQVWRCLDAASDQARPAPSHPESVGPPPRTNSFVHESAVRLKELLSSLADTEEDVAAQECGGRSSKRRRLDAEGEDDDNDPPLAQTVVNPPIDDAEPDLPEDLVNSLVDIYFARIQPWIPMLHTVTFRRDMNLPSMRPRLRTIFSAIISICTRFSDDPRLGSVDAKSRLAKKHRQRVILESMESFSARNLQALIIVAFDTSIVGSMTRTVEQLRLSVEDENRYSSTNDAKVLIKRMDFLPQCQDWLESEEQRRIFWNTFLMDRFCSIATGWNLSLTGADVKRRLPCEGYLWEKGMPLAEPTPYFGVSEKSDRLNDPLPSPRSETAHHDSQNSLGGFAYSIEATESLSLVTTFFLQQAVNVTKVHELELWLMRFKQLDLRLVQYAVTLEPSPYRRRYQSTDIPTRWKIFLPDRWREGCARGPDGRMDCNLILAHVTHNTAVVLLHQCIAYPSPEWQAIPLRLPSSSSAETCLAAAKEVAIITDNFLRCTDFLVNPQFSFCLFVCGRMLITHAAYSGTPLTQEFETLVHALQEVSRRWNGSHASLTMAKPCDDLASKFASRLLNDRTSVPDMGDMRQAVYSDVHVTLDLPSSPKPSHVQGSAAAGYDFYNPATNLGQAIQFSENAPSRCPNTEVLQQDSPPDKVSMAFPPLPVALEMSTLGQSSTTQKDLGHVVPASAMYDAAAANPAASSTSAAYETGDSMFEMLNSYLDLGYPADQRISMFSHFGDGDGGT